MSMIPFGFGMDPFGDLGLGSMLPTLASASRRSILPASASTALAPMDDRQLLDFGRLAADPLPVDVEDREGEYLVRVHQREAGMRKKDLRVDVEHGMLTIRGERESESGDSTQGHYSRRYRSVCRSMELPENVDQNKIQARYEGNNLMIHVPKTGATGGRRSIQIGGGMGMGAGQGAGTGQGAGAGQPEHKQAEKPTAATSEAPQGQAHAQTHGQGHGQAHAQTGAGAPSPHAQTHGQTHGQTGTGAPSPHAQTGTGTGATHGQTQGHHA